MRRYRATYNALTDLQLEICRHPDFPIWWTVDGFRSLGNGTVLVSFEVDSVVDTRPARSVTVPLNLLEMDDAPVDPIAKLISDARLREILEEYD